MTRTFFKSAAHQQEFAEKGYVKVDFCDTQKIEDFLAEVGQLQPHDQFDPEVNKVSPYTLSYHFTFSDSNESYKRKVQELIFKHFEPNVKAVLADYNLLTGNLFVKPPQKGKIHLHQNAFAAENEHTCITIWFPLQDTDVLNGTLHVIEASHKIMPHITAPPLANYWQSFEQDLEENYLKPLPVKKGEAICICESLIHGSPQNQSAIPRIGVQLATYPAECSPVIFVPDEKKEVFNLYPVDTEFFINHSVDVMFMPAPDMQPVKTMPIENRLIDKDEFNFRMAEGPKVREALYEGRQVVYEPFKPASSTTETVTAAPPAQLQPTDAPPAEQPAGFFAKLKRMFFS